MFKKIDHIAIATEDIDKALSVYRDIFGIAVTYRKVFKELGVEVAGLGIGEGCIEFVKPLDKESQAAKFLKERGEGIHHIAFEVEDIEKSMHYDKKVKDGMNYFVLTKDIGSVTVTRIFDREALRKTLATIVTPPKG